MFNNAGQHYNHIHFWKWMKPGGGGDKIPGALEKKIVADLGSVTKMKEDFVQAGVTQFGSGWCWLAVKDGKIVVMKTANGESPLVQGAKPILGCDVWEHAYYIDYRNRRRFSRPGRHFERRYVDEMSAGGGRLSLIPPEGPRRGRPSVRGGWGSTLTNPTGAPLRSRPPSPAGRIIKTLGHHARARGEHRVGAADRGLRALLDTQRSGKRVQVKPPR